MLQDFPLEFLEERHVLSTFPKHFAGENSSAVMMVADLALKAAEPARRLEFVVELGQSSAMSYIYMWPAVLPWSTRIDEEDCLSYQG